MIEVKPNFHMFSEEEVLENLVINQVNIQKFNPYMHKKYYLFNAGPYKCKSK